MSQPKWHRVLMATALAGAGAFVGANISITDVAHGEITAGQERHTFESGGQQSVPILREIASTLRQMDSRLARLETVAQKLRSTPARSAATDESSQAGETN